MLKKNAKSRSEYVARMNRVIAFIDKHLNEDLNLDTLADVAAYSKFHFHRIFRASMGEPLAEYILRRRLEKAAYRLSIDAERSITDIALDCGFSNSAVFAKNFRTRFGLSASEWRNSRHMISKQYEAENIKRKSGSLNKKMSITYGYGSQTWMIQQEDGERQVRLETMPEMTLAYLWYTGAYKGDESLFQDLFTRLFSWLAPRQLISPDILKVIVIYHEYPEITMDEQLRLSACCTVPAGTIGEGEIGIMPFSPGLCAISQFECAADEYQCAWDWMYEIWLPESGFLPSDVPAFERYDFNSYDKDTGKAIVDVCIPLMGK